MSNNFYVFKEIAIDGNIYNVFAPSMEEACRLVNFNVEVGKELDLIKTKRDYNIWKIKPTHKGNLMFGWFILEVNDFIHKDSYIVEGF